MSTVPRLRALSLGAGVQSTTLALMAAEGEIGPMPDCAIFSDTGWEPQKVYDHLDWLTTPGRLPFPVFRVSQGNLRDSIRNRRNTTGGRFAAIPWYITNPDGSPGMGRRQCTSEYKLKPIMHKLRDILGVSRRARISKGAAEIWIGISTDEASRMKPATSQWQVNRFPLIEKMMSRRDCIKWLVQRGYPIPPKSSCLGCPFHNDAAWRDLRDNSPEEWAQTVEDDKALRLGDARGMRGLEFMHSSRVPLGEVDLSTAEDRGQLNMFNNECLGMCGV